MLYAGKHDLDAWMSHDGWLWVFVLAPRLSTPSPPAALDLNDQRVHGTFGPMRLGMRSARSRIGIFTVTVAPLPFSQVICRLQLRSQTVDDGFA